MVCTCLSIKPWTRIVGAAGSELETLFGCKLLLFLCYKVTVTDDLFGNMKH